MVRLRLSVEHYPGQNSRYDMFALSSGIAGLALGNASELFDLPVVLLNLPAKSACFCSVVGCEDVLMVIGDHVVGAVWMDRQPKQSKFEGEFFELSLFAKQQLLLVCPGEVFYCPVAGLGRVSPVVKHEAV